MWSTQLPGRIIFDQSLNRPGQVAVTTRVTLEGPFFAKDPSKTFYQNLHDMLENLAQEMGENVRSAIASHATEMPYWTGWTLRTVEGYTQSKQTGKHWATWAAVGTVTAGMNRADAIRTKAAAAGRHTPRGVRPNGTTRGIEQRWHPFRNLKSGIYRSRALLSVDLAKGMN